jgi:hypothetical protein
MKIKSLVLASTCLALAASVQAQSTYNGNGATGFGGPVGNGNLQISDSISGLNITFNPGAPLNDDLVLYLDTQPGGFADTSLFGDTADGGRTAISGFNSGNPSRTLATFAPGFFADYAISVENGFMGVFGLAPGGNGSLTYLFGAGQSGNPAGPFSISITPPEMSQIGLTAGSGQTFEFVGSLISTSAYRANETIGPSVTGGSPNAGFGGPQQFLGSDSYTLVPEPGTMTLIGTGLAGLLSLRRRK